MRHASFISRSLSAVGLFFAAVSAHAAVYDVDLDGSIDTADLAVIRAAEQLPVLKPVRITLLYGVQALQPGYSEDNIFDGHAPSGRARISQDRE